MTRALGCVILIEFAGKTAGGFAPCKLNNEDRKHQKEAEFLLYW